MLRRWKLLIVIVLLLWPLTVQAQETTPPEETEAPPPVEPLLVEYTFSPLRRATPDLYPDPDFAAPFLPDTDDVYMQEWRPHPRYVNGSCAWFSTSEDEGMLISIDAICLSPPQRALFRNISLTAVDRTGRPLGGTLMTYRNNESVGVYPITKSPFELTVDADEAFDRVGIYFRRPTLFDDVVLSY